MSRERENNGEEHGGKDVGWGRKEKGLLMLSGRGSKEGRVLEKKTLEDLRKLH